MSSIALPTESNRIARLVKESQKRKPKISQRKKDANQTNARKSTGPKSPEGKAKVSKNATTHGLTVAPPPEADPTYCTRLYELKEEHRPNTPSQHYLVEQLAHIAWKL